VTPRWWGRWVVGGWAGEADAWARTLGNGELQTLSPTAESEEAASKARLGLKGPWIGEHVVWSGAGRPRGSANESWHGDALLTTGTSLTVSHPAADEHGLGIWRSASSFDMAARNSATSAEGELLMKEG